MREKAFTFSKTNSLRTYDLPVVFGRVILKVIGLELLLKKIDKGYPFNRSKNLGWHFFKKG